MSSSILAQDFTKHRPIFNQDRGKADFPSTGADEVIQWLSETDVPDTPTDDFKLIGNGQGQTWFNAKLEGANVDNMLDLSITFDFYKLDKTTLVNSITLTFDPVDTDDFVIGDDLIEYAPSPRLVENAPYVKITGSSTLAAPVASAILRVDIDYVLN